MRSSYKLWTAVLTAAGGLAALHRARDADVFFHLELGRAVLSHGARTVPEPHAFPEFEPTCLVPAWLWDIAAYGVYRAGGFEALSIANLVVALAASFALARVAYAWRDAAPFVGFAAVSAAGLICASARFELRPQTLALGTLAGFLWLAHAHVGRRGRARVHTGVALVVLALVWAQLHGSFVLAPALFAIAAGTTFEPSERRTDLLVLCGTLLALFSSAAGLDVAAYIAGHGSGDAVRFIAEMRPPMWAELVSFRGARGKAIALLWLLSLFGLTRHGRFQLGPILFALLGHAMLSRAQRFIAEDAILSMPLALAGAANLAHWAESAFAPRLRRVLGPGCVLASALLVAQHVHASREGRFGIGLDRNAYPQLAAAYLARSPAGTRVLSAFGAGPALGFWSQGRLRTFVDGRTPLYFDDADYAVEREVFTNPEVLDLAIQRYGVQAAVVDRAHGVCDLLAARWSAVVIEGAYSTFVPRDRAAPLAELDPCGPEFVRGPKSAAQLAGLDHSIARLTKLGEVGFIDYLRAERMLLGAQRDPAQLARWLERSASPVYASAHRRTQIAAAIATERTEEAYDRMTDALRAGDVSVLRFLVAPELGTLSLPRARALLELGIGALGEAASPGLRAMLAAVCVQQRDAACARYEGLRAALRRAPNTEPTLAWLADNAETARMRRDARAWLELLRAEREAQTTRSTSTFK